MSEIIKIMSIKTKRFPSGCQASGVFETWGGFRQGGLEQTA